MAVLVEVEEIGMIALVGWLEGLLKWVLAKPVAEQVEAAAMPEEWLPQQTGSVRSYLAEVSAAHICTQPLAEY